VPERPNVVALARSSHYCHVLLVEDGKQFKNYEMGQMCFMGMFRRPTHAHFQFFKLGSGIKLPLFGWKSDLIDEDKAAPCT
jgi:hypothetical protein